MHAYYSFYLVETAVEQTLFRIFYAAFLSFVVITCSLKAKDDVPFGRGKASSFFFSENTEIDGSVSTMLVEVRKLGEFVVGWMFHDKDSFWP